MGGWLHLRPSTNQLRGDVQSLPVGPDGSGSPVAPLSSCCTRPSLTRSPLLQRNNVMASAECLYTLTGIKEFLVVFQSHCNRYIGIATEIKINHS